MQKVVTILAAAIIAGSTMIAQNFVPQIENRNGSEYVQTEINNSQMHVFNSNSANTHKHQIVVRQESEKRESFEEQPLNEERSFNDSKRLNLQQNNRRIETFDGQTYRLHQVSEGLQIKKLDLDAKRPNSKPFDGYVVSKEIKNQPPETRNTNKLTINFVGLDYILISDGIDFFYEDFIFSSPLEIDVPDGNYDIMIMGSMPVTFDAGFYCLGQIPVFEDTELTADIADVVKIFFKL